MAGQISPMASSTVAACSALAPARPRIRALPTSYTVRSRTERATVRSLWASRSARAGSTSSSPSEWNHFSTTFASLTTLIAGIALLPLRADHLGRLKAAELAQRGTTSQERCVNRKRVRPTKSSPRCLLEKNAAGLAEAFRFPVDPLQQIVRHRHENLRRSCHAEIVANRYLLDI